MGKIKFELNVINWRAISAMLTFAGIMIALILPPLRNRKKIKFTLVMAMPAHDPLFVDICIHAINVKSTPIRVMLIVVDTKKRKQKNFFLEGINTLTQDHTFSHTFPYLVEESENIKRIYIMDAAGKKFRVSKTMTKKIKDSCKHLKGREY